MFKKKEKGKGRFSSSKHGNYFFIIFVKKNYASHQNHTKANL